PLKFRRLAIIRTAPVPGGPQTQRLTDRFTTAGGLFLKPSEEEIRTLHAVHQLKGEADFFEWVKSRQPISGLELIRSAVPSPLLFGDGSKTEKTAVRNAALLGSLETKSSQ